ncbi:NAD-dependent epimerase/dehydratase family protein [Maribellus sediminis]|uniref:NAD-dependent epimerase/dehydratase family protein n=1 Tax=Maribellus sediminis TaxID=2696285 RepID=UPI0014316765|nr:NAD(P)-dependent oxidoreductase [Maribellus sediminis]
MERLIITGGSGFIGSNLVEYYSGRKTEVINLDFKAPTNKSHKKFWKQVDINDYLELEKCITGFKPTYILHFAARTDLNGKSLENYSSNTLGTKNIIDISKKLKSLKRVICTSSMLVCKPGYQPKSSTDYAPSTIYGESKVKMEEIIRTENPKFEWAIIRPTSIWGPGFGVPYRNFFDMVINKRYFHIGEKACTKTYGYIGNVVEQVDAILKTPIDKIQGQVFYVGDYEPTNIRDWANEIGDELGIKIRTVPYTIVKLAGYTGDILKLAGINFPMTSFRLKNMTTDNIMDLSNTKQLLPELSFSRKEGIKHTLKWLRENQ